MAFVAGQTVKLNDGRSATIKWLGQAHFAAGDWIGVELQSATGKNDGAVNGERYFNCKPGYGMFVRPSMITVVADVKKPAPQRNSVVGKPNSASSSGTSTPRNGVSASRPAANGPRSRPSVSSRPSMAPPALPSAGNRSSRQSVSNAVPTSRGAQSSTATARLGSNGRQSLRPSSISSVGRLGSVGSDSQTSDGSNDRRRPAESRSPPLGSGPMNGISDSIVELSKRTAMPAGSTLDAVTSPEGLISPKTKAAPAVPLAQAGKSVSSINREVEDLKAKIRLMERRRMEDREKMKKMGDLQADRDRFETIIQKLQAKLKPQQQDILSLKQQLKEADARLQEVETQKADNEVVVEMATLDKEMAEETAEVLKAEVEVLKRKAEELELELDILKEEHTELGSTMSPEEKNSQGWLQMEKTNERLREALIRLRDITQETEAELRDEVKSLDEEVRGLSDIKAQLEATKERLTQSEAQKEDLVQQLETALGAEEMIEELTEKNMEQGEQIDQLRAAIEELEALKELSDELEATHMETEKALQEEIEFKDSKLAEAARRAAQQDEALDASEYTNSRFRELVANMQTDLEDLKASREITEAESEQLTNQSRTMMDLNMKLQISASKTQNKTIDLELRRLEAQEAKEHLSIVQLFLPDSFQTDRDSVLALLRFRRVSFKSQLLHGFLSERVHVRAASGREEDIFAACEALDKLTWVFAMCERFINCISSCSAEQFARFEGALYELEPVERALNGWIDGLRRDELKEKVYASELHRTMALMSHLAEIHIPETIESYADTIHMKVLVVQSHLENTATAISQLRDMSQAKIPRSGDDDFLAQQFAERADLAISQARSAKVVVGKAVRSLEELRSRSLSLRPYTAEVFEKCEDISRLLAEYGRTAGVEVCKHLFEEGREVTPSYEDIQTVLNTISGRILDSEESEPFGTINSKLRVLIASVNELYSTTNDLTQTVEFERAPAPWVARATEIRASKIIPLDTEEEMKKLKEEIHARATEIAIRDKNLEESSVKIEMLEARTKEWTKKNNKLEELERAVETGKAREKDLADAIEAQVKELQGLENDREKYKRMAYEQRPVGDVGTAGTKQGAGEAAASFAEIAELKAQVEYLENEAVHLFEDAQRVKVVEVKTALAGLEEVLKRVKANEEGRLSLVCTEARDVLKELISLSRSSDLFDMSSTPSPSKRGWRPKSVSPVYHISKQQEQYYRWDEWREEVMGKSPISSRLGYKPISPLSFTPLRVNMMQDETFSTPSKPMGQQLLKIEE